MNKWTQQVKLKVGLLIPLLMLCQPTTYAAEDSSQAIIVSTPDDPNHPVKLRPFVRNRPLPSRAEVAALQEERARMAEVRSSTLNGKISAFDKYQSPNYNSCARTNNVRRRSNPSSRANQAAFTQPAIANIPAPRPPITQVAPQNSEQIPSLAAVEPAPVVHNDESFSFLRMAEQHLSSLFNHPPDSVSQMQQAAPQTEAPQMGETFSIYPTGFPAQTVQPMTNAPSSLSLSPVANTSSFNEPTSFGSAGPPPFPLNLLPAPALKQLIRSMAYANTTHVGSGPRTYFGCWHNSSTFSSNSPTALYASAAPPQGNFHSYLRLAYSHNYNRSVYAPSAVTTSHKHLHSSKILTRTNQTTKLINYPAYSKQNVPGVNLSK